MGKAQSGSLRRLLSPSFKEGKADIVTSESKDQVLVLRQGCQGWLIAPGGLTDCSHLGTRIDIVLTN